MAKKVKSMLLPAAGAVLGSTILPGLGFAIPGAATIGGAAGGAAGGKLAGHKGLGLILDAVGGGVYPNATDILDTVSGGISSAGQSIGNATGLTDLINSTVGGADIPSPALSTALSGADKAAAAAGSTVSAPALAGTSGVGSTALSGATEDFLKNIASSSASAAPAASSGGIMSFLKDNITPLTLASSVLQGDKQPVGMDQLQAHAGMAGKVGEDLVNSLATGKLPPGAQASIDEQVNSAIASIKSKYGQMGLSGSTMEVQEIEHAKQMGQALAFQYASQATQTGLNALGTSDQVYQTIMNTTLQQDQALMDVLARFAASSSGATA